MELAVIPVYQSEITPAPLRGFVLSTHQSSLLVRILPPPVRVFLMELIFVDRLAALS